MAGPSQADGLGRWLVGGLVVGALVLGLMVTAYAIGYNRGQDSESAAPPATTTPTTPTTTTPTTTTPTTTTSAGDAVALGKQLFTSDSCSGCHSLDGSPGAGPTMKGLAGSQVHLSDGTTVTADDKYLVTAISDPDAEIVQGYQKGVMSGAIASFGLHDAANVNQLLALVAFIKSQR